MAECLECGHPGLADPSMQVAGQGIQLVANLLEHLEQLIRVASGQVSFHIVRAEITAARRTAENFLQVAKTAGTPETKFTAHQLMGTTLFHQGQLMAARGNLETASSQYKACVQEIDVPTRWSGADPRNPGVAVPSWLAVTLCLLGRYAEARVQCELALTEARRSRRLHWLAFALGANGWLHQLLGEDATSQIDELALLSKEQGLRYSSDLTDEEWERIAPLMPKPGRRGRPREVEFREVINAVR